MWFFEKPFLLFNNQFQVSLQLVWFMFLKTSFYFLMFSVWTLPFEEKHYLEDFAWIYKGSMLSSKLKAISSTDASLTEFRKVVKCDRILKSPISEESISWTSVFLFWFEILNLKYSSTIRKISKTSADIFHQRSPLSLTLMRFDWGIWGIWWRTSFGGIPF